MSERAKNGQAWELACLRVFPCSISSCISHSLMLIPFSRLRCTCIRWSTVCVLLFAVTVRVSYLLMKITLGRWVDWLREKLHCTKSGWTEIAVAAKYTSGLLFSISPSHLLDVSIALYSFIANIPSFSSSSLSRVLEWKSRFHRRITIKQCRYFGNFHCNIRPQ